MKEILDKIYVTTCGRIFVKESPYRTIKSLGENPTLRGTFLRFIRRNNLKEEDFDIEDTGMRGGGNHKLFYFKYKKWSVPFLEIKGAVDSYGYIIVSLFGKSYKAHRVIMQYFKPIDNYDKMQINHIDGNKTNNCILNLEWCTSKENINHAWRTGLAKADAERQERGRQTTISKLSIEHVMNPNYKGQKPNIKSFLRARGLSWDDYEYVITGRTKSRHALGYLKKKER
jgi:hypothetical protein